MKRCPQCNRTYADETITFCLADGALLSAPFDPNSTWFLPTLSSPDSSPTEVLPTEPAPPMAQRTAKPYLLYVVILLLSVLVAGGAVALYYEKEKPQKASPTEQVATSSPEPDTSKDSKRAISASPQPTAEVSKNQGRFSVSPCGSIKDDTTGLEWIVGPDRNMTWYEAQQWTVELKMCGGGWRMPTIEEIRSLYNPALKAGTGFYLNGKYYPAHIDSVFSAIGRGSWVWANERIGTTNARSFNLSQGIAVEYSAMDTVMRISS
jgi:hypothetical protein